MKDPTIDYNIRGQRGSLRIRNTHPYPDGFKRLSPDHPYPDRKPTRVFLTSFKAENLPELNDALAKGDFSHIELDIKCARWLAEKLFHIAKGKGLINWEPLEDKRPDARNFREGEDSFDCPKGREPRGE